MSKRISVTQATKDYIWRGSSLIAMHQIGPYDIVEYWSAPADNAKDRRRYRCFGIYIDGNRKGHCFLSMDEALAGCIAIHHEGLNARAHLYFICGISAQTEPEYEEARAPLPAH